MSPTERLAKETGLVIYARSHDGKMWISGLEKWMTPAAIRKEALRRIEEKEAQS
jgi:hypothetical protein